MSRKVFSHKVLIKVLVTTNKELCIYIQSQMNKMLNAVITDCFYLLKQDTQTEQFVVFVNFRGGISSEKRCSHKIFVAKWQLGKFEDFS